LIRIYLHTFENGLSDIKILIENINVIIFKKAEKSLKRRIFLLKADKVAGLLQTPLHYRQLPITNSSF